MLPSPVRAAAVLTRAGVVRPHRPTALVGCARALLSWGVGTASGSLTLAHRFPDEVGLIDERGELTFAEISGRSNALARGLAERGVREGDGVAVMCRNSRYFVEASYAVARLGADVLYLNTSFAGPQLVEVIGRERPAAIVYDEEFSGLLDGVDAALPRVLAWSDDDSAVGGAAHGDSCESLMSRYDGTDLPPPGRESRSTILTSGTTGSPKGASRAGGIDAAVSLLSRIPLRARWSTYVAAPLFHTWGWAHFQLALLLGSTLVLQRRFEPEQCLALVERHRCASLVVIPVMLQRVLDTVGPKGERPATHDLSSLRVVAASGSPLPGDLATRWMDVYGDTLYNVYGSTECAWATVATPADLRAAPGTAGRPPPGTEVRLFDESDRPVDDGQVGRIFVRNSMLFQGYTSGGAKPVIGDMMATGDVGRFDEAGRLFVEGRDDDMIVSGGENVFPQEVEDLLSQHEAVADVAAVGVPDEQYGQRLAAYVVLRAGADTSEDDLKAHVKANLARYKVPREVVFLDQLPRNATGKVVKRDLPRKDARAASSGEH